MSWWSWCLLSLVVVLLVLLCYWSKFVGKLIAWVISGVLFIAFWLVDYALKIICYVPRITLVAVLRFLYERRSDNLPPAKETWREWFSAREYPHVPDEYARLRRLGEDANKMQKLILGKCLNVQSRLMSLERQWGTLTAGLSAEIKFKFRYSAT